MAEIAELTRKRGQAKGFITRAEAFAAAIKADTPLDILRVRLDLLEKAFLNFADSDSALALLEQDSEMVAVENRYVDLKAKLNEHIRSKLPKPPVMNQDLNATVTRFTEQQREFMDGLHDRSFIQREDVRLPSISIPSFSGNCADFPSFKNLFEVTIHNTSMPKIHKFKYLLGLLRNEASALLKHINVTDENYEGAWEKLVQRYDKKQQIVSNLVKKFLSQPNIRGGSVGLRQLADVTDEVLRGLEALGQEAQQRDCWLIHLLLEKCDIETKRAWALFNVQDYPTIQDLLKFLTSRVDSLETIEVPMKAVQRKPVVLTSIVDKRICPCCSNEHMVSECNKFIELGSADRRSLASERHLCFNCLLPGHQAGRCRFKLKCKKCGRRHHTLLCMEEVISSTVNKLDLQNPTSPRVTSAQLNACGINQAILPTAIVRISNGFGRTVTCRALLDSGSQVSIIDEELANKLSLARTNCRINISGVGTHNVVSRGLANVEIGSRFYDGEAVNTEVLILSKLPIILPGIVLSTEQVGRMKLLNLADPTFDRKSTINLLIGAGVFIASITEGREHLGGNVFALKTMFGYVVSGNVETADHVSNLNIMVDVDKTLRRFWELEEINCNGENSEENELAETFFKTTTTRSNTGRFIVKLPFKTNCGDLGNSFRIANKRFLATERRLMRDPGLQSEYVKFMREYEELNHMSKVPLCKKTAEFNSGYYLPHHAVVKLRSLTTKVRVVFDGSCITSTGMSLNNMLICGPVVQSSLWEILLRFRRFRYVMAADIEKMYRQILIAESDKKYQQILWREDPNQHLNRYCMNTVTYGTSSAPFLATRCLKELGLQHLHEFPKAARAIIGDFYVDDFLSGANTIAELEILKSQVCQILTSAGFMLRKWAYNFKITEVPSDYKLELDKADGPLKLLGVKWCPKEDVFTFDADQLSEETTTKRQFLSNASKVFDPLGWLAPSTIISKTIFQELWMLNLDWDDVLPPEIQSKWNKLHREFEEFRKLKIPRFTGSENCEVHGFCDASKVAYGAVVYTRRTDESGSITTNIIAAKTKVAPLKAITIPRLELCGALLLSKLLKSISAASNIPVEKMKAWTDSAVVLAYLSAHPSKWKPFVANRVSEILVASPRNIWGHVRSADNPADLASRGVYPTKLINNDLWWHGPSWLRSSEISSQPLSNDPDSSSDNVNCSITDELRVSVNVVKRHDHENIIQLLIKEKSSCSKVIRIVATMCRFISRCRRDRISSNEMFLSTTELRQAEMLVIKHVQKSYFEDDIKAIKANRELSSRSSIKSLAPFLDEGGILRVGGRLKNAACDYDAKHQLLLPRSCKWSKLLMIYLHGKHIHPGTALTFSMSRQRYWIVQGRSLANQVVRECVICRRYKAQSPSQIMGQLPKSRITGTRAFINTGIDYAGPITIASKRGRGAKMTKGYIAVFVCTTTKAIHLDLVTDLTANAFIACLKRFVSRRGVPVNIYSDNGKNFVGARAKLHKLASVHNGGMREILQTISSEEFNTELGNYTAKNSINWHFIPPLAPHFGGLWESAVKSVKTHLKKATGSINLTYEEMSTLLCLIEAILNSRPLVPQFDNDASYEAITPGHFLIGSPMTSIPEPFLAESINNKNIWDEIQLRTTRFWKKYKTEYLHTLQQRQKWMNISENIQPGDVVILKDENYPPCHWPLGRIISTHPGADGHIRVVTVKTSQSTFKRPLTKIVKLLDN